MDLRGKVAIVTGAGRGLGRAYAEELAAAGSAVVVNDIDAAAAEATVAMIRADGGQAVAEIAAVGTEETANALIGRAVTEFGRLDTLVTNAGIVRDRTLLNMSDEEFDAVIFTHLRGTFTCGRAASRRMHEQGAGGSLILVSSVSGQRGNFGQTNYAAAKAGIAAMARTWAMELARDQIRVNALIPNALTSMAATVPVLRDLVARAERGESFGAEVRQAMWMGTVADVAPMVVFLASDEAKDVTGQCIGIGGDKIARWAHPFEVSVAYKDGGWSAEAIAANWRTSIGAAMQTFGVDFLKPTQPHSRPA